MSVIISNKYEIHDLLGEGTFGKVFKGKNIRTREEIAIKIQHKDISDVLRHEAKIYKFLKDVSGIPQLRNYGSFEGFNYLIIDLMGPCLAEKKITPLESINYLISALNIIEFVHDKGILHRDIKPDNFLIKKSENIIGNNNLYLIDFGLSKYYLTPDKKHMEERKDRKLIGTAKYSSLNVHNGIEASRRDDIESICYCFILIYGKTLPWNDIYNSNSDTKDLKSIYEKIKNKKEESLEWLYDIPGEFLIFLLYCRKLQYYDKPNYNYLRGLFTNLIQR